MTMLVSMTIKKVTDQVIEIIAKSFDYKHTIGMIDDDIYLLNHGDSSYLFRIREGFRYTCNKDGRCVHVLFVRNGEPLIDVHHDLCNKDMMLTLEDIPGIVEDYMRGDFNDLNKRVEKENSTI